MSTGGLEHERDAIVVMERTEHAAKRREQILDRKRAGAHDGLARLDPREVEQVVDERQQRLGAAADVGDLAFLLVGQRAVRPPQQQVTQRQRRAQRRSQLVADARQEPRLRLAGAAELLGAFVELGVQREHSPVGFLEFAVELCELVAAGVQFLERCHQLLVLKLKLTDRRVGLCPCKLAGDTGELGVGRRCAGQALCKRHGRTGSSLGLDLEPVHQPPRADDPKSHPRL